MRRLSRVSAPTPAGVNTVLLTCPAGHKYEIIDVCFESAGGTNDKAILFLTLAGPTFPILGEITVPTGDLGAKLSFNGMPFFAGESFSAGIVATGVALTVTVSYIDVSPV